MLILLLGTLAIILAVLQTRTIQRRIEKQGLAIAKNLSAISVDLLVTYNYVALEKMANQTANNPEIVSVIIHDKEGRVAAYSKKPDFQNRLLKDSVSQIAVAANAPLIHIRDGESGNMQVMDVAVPVFLANTKDRWGTVRICLSLALMHEQIRQTIWIIVVLGGVSLALGILVSNWIARRVTKPLEKLTYVTVEAAKGNLEQEIDIKTGDEIELLASNFSYMVKSILAQKEQLEGQLQEIGRLQQYAQKILTTMNDGLLVVDMEGRVKEINPAASAILMLNNTDRAKGESVLKYLETNPELSAYISQHLENPLGNNQREIHLYSQNESQVILAGSGILESIDKTPAEIIFNLNDITAIKKLEAEVRQTQRLADLGTLAAGMAHEIRNPLSAIKTYVALLPQKKEKPGFLEKFESIVPREINRLNVLIEELLVLSRPPKYNFTRMDVKTVVNNTLELLEAGFENKKITCDSQIMPDPMEVMADPDQLEKVFLNLMQNAIHAMPEGGVLTVSVLCENNWILVKIRDTGKGISSEDIENIFNPFFSTKSKGTGLGLTVSHKVVTEHRGQIDVKSTMGKGTCFTVLLPASLDLG
ncbi:MAG: HAMP domain-containing protein [Desulfobacteraceae bacterium]|nr:HAMP domain-containing protein [Desulfobacteraceae bacterium]